MIHVWAHCLKDHPSQKVFVLSQINETCYCSRSHENLLGTPCKALMFAEDANFKDKLIMQNEMRMLKQTACLLFFCPTAIFYKFGTIIAKSQI